MKLGTINEEETTHVDSVDQGIHEVMSEGKTYKGWENMRIQIDSGVVDTVGPKSVGRAFQIKETKASK